MQNNFDILKMFNLSFLNQNSKVRSQLYRYKIIEIENRVRVRVWLVRSWLSPEFLCESCSVPCGSGGGLNVQPQGVLFCLDAVIPLNHSIFTFAGNCCKYLIKKYVVKKVIIPNLFYLFEYQKIPIHFKLLKDLKAKK